MKPTVLVAVTSRWYPTARLAVALMNTGCTVEAICPSRHPLCKIRSIRRIHTYHALAPLSSLEAAIAATKPDVIVPGDDRAVSHLHDLYRRELTRGRADSAICALMERSLGRAESLPIVCARAAFLQLAQEEGIRVPKTAVLATTNDLRKCADVFGFPMVLKANGTSGGEGVRIVHTLKEAERAFRRLQAPPLLARAAKRAVFDRDWTLLRPFFFRRRSVVNAQEFVRGREATSMVACWQGSLLASLHFEVLNKAKSTGPSSVLRWIDNADMCAAAEKVVRRLKLSGFHGFDFILELATGNPYLIEINPRATQIGHLTLGPGRDLPAALYAAISGQPIREAPKITENDTIALFPAEWQRDPTSPYLRSGYHDVPWGEPELIRAFRARGIPQRNLFSLSAFRLPSSDGA